MNGSTKEGLATLLLLGYSEGSRKGSWSNSWGLVHNTIVGDFAKIFIETVWHSEQIINKWCKVKCS